MSALADTKAMLVADGGFRLTGAAAPFDSWQGPVMEVRRDGTLLQANQLAHALTSVLLSGTDSAVRNLVALSFDAHASISDRVCVVQDGKTSWYECIVVPIDRERALILARDETYNLNVREALFESRQRYRDLVVISSDFAWETDAKGIFVFVSPHGAMGYSAADLVGHHPIEFIIENDIDKSDLPFSTRRPLSDTQIWMRGADGQEACFVTAAVPVMDGDGNWCGARGLCRNVTQQRLRDSALAQAKVREQVVAYIVNQIREQARPAAMLEAAVAMLGRAVSASAAVYRRAKNGEYELAATHDDWPNELVVASVLPSSAAVSEPFSSKSTGYRTMASVTHYRGVANGVVILARPLTMKAWSDDEEAMLRAVAGQLAIALRQIDDQDELERLSSTDGLTGLMNRRAFQRALETAVIRAHRNHTGGALLYVDLDNFKSINDTYGHEAGDNILREVAEILASHSRTYDLVARIGGDEFVVWLDGVDFSVARRRAGELATVLAGLSRHSAKGAPRLGASVGVVEFDPDHDVDVQQLVSRADQAMYDVKAHNRKSHEVAIGALHAAGNAGRHTDVTSVKARGGTGERTS